jgi:hypothetical protein
MHSRWFLFGAVVGFILLLFEMGKWGSEQSVANGTASATGASGGCGCGCSQTIPTTALTSVPSETPPAAASPGGSGFQWQFSRSIGPVAPYVAPIIAGPVTVGSGGGSGQQYGNAIPGRTQSFAVPGNGVIQ